MHFKQTEVFRFDTESEVQEFCAKLLMMKSAAPKSLHLTIAVTVERKVELRGNGRAATNVVVAQRSTPTPRRKKGRRTAFAVPGGSRR